MAPTNAVDLSLRPTLQPTISPLPIPRPPLQYTTGSGGSLAAATYWVEYTCVNGSASGAGETLPSPAGLHCGRCQWSNQSYRRSLCERSVLPTTFTSVPVPASPRITPCGCSMRERSLPIRCASLPVRQLRWSGLPADHQSLDHQHLESAHLEQLDARRRHHATGCGDGHGDTTP